MSYDNWRKRLDIYNRFSTVAERRAAIAPLKINFSQPQTTDEGYYRKPVTQRLPNGLNKVIGWVPVAYFLGEVGEYKGVLLGVIGAGQDQRNMLPDEVANEELWSYVVANPISYEEYEHVADNGGRWSDEPLERAPAEIKADRVLTERVVERTDNLPPEIDPLTEHKEGIENAAKAALANYGKEITSAAMMAEAEGARNRLAELRLSADKTGKALYDPPYREYKRLHGLWTPMVKIAQDAEDRIKQRCLFFIAAEKRREQEAQAERDRLAQEELERNARAADRAIMNGEPEPEPEITEPEPAPVVQAAPPKPTYGTRTTKATERWHFDGVTDWAKVIEHYKDSSELKALLTQLATRDVKQGHEVPGTKRHFGVI